MSLSSLGSEVPTPADDCESMDRPATPAFDFHVHSTIDAVIVKGILAVPRLVFRRIGAEWRVVMTPDTQVAMQPEFRTYDPQLVADPLADQPPFWCSECTALIIIQDDNQVIRMHVLGAVSVLVIRTDGVTWLPNGVSGGPS